MSIEKALEMLDKSRMFTVEGCYGGGYVVRFKDDHDENPLFASYNEGWSYHVSGLYNCGCDAVEIDMGRLAALKSFCESLGGE